MLQTVFYFATNKEPHSELCGPSFGRKERIYRSRKVAN